LDQIETEMYLVYPGFFDNERDLKKAVESERLLLEKTMCDHEQESQELET